MSSNEPSSTDGNDTAGANATLRGGGGRGATNVSNNYTHVSASLSLTPYELRQAGVDMVNFAFADVSPKSVRSVGYFY